MHYEIYTILVISYSIKYNKANTTVRETGTELNILLSTLVTMPQTIKGTR